MNATNAPEARTFFTPAGAVLALLCFFLPWVKQPATCRQTTQGIQQSSQRSQQ